MGRSLLSASYFRIRTKHAYTVLLLCPTQGDCYMVAGGLMSKDADGFNSVSVNSDHAANAKKVRTFLPRLFMLFSLDTWICSI